MFKKKILIIDDTEFMQRLMKDILTSANYDVVVACDGFQGIRKVREEKPDLVILDIVMPGMNGLEVCKILRDDESNNLMPIIIVTSQDNEEDKLSGLELGADDYITKPFNPREILSRVRNTLRRIDRNRWANPLTGLQGNLEIQSEISKRLALDEHFALIYLDLDNFKAYNDVYGFARGDRAIKLTADILLTNVHIMGSINDFVGHVGGDDFVILTTVEKADAISEGIINDFSLKIRELYDSKDKERGYIITTNRLGQQRNFPIMTISIAVVTNENRKFESHVEISDAVAEVKKEG